MLRRFTFLFGRCSFIEGALDGAGAFLWCVGRLLDIGTVGKKRRPVVSVLLLRI